MRAVLAAIALTGAVSAAQGVAVRSAIGDLHGFPSMSDQAGHVIATGELRQERHGAELAVHITWNFRDGRVVDEFDGFTIDHQLEQTLFSWTEKDGSGVRRRFKVDFKTHHAESSVRGPEGTEREDTDLDLEPGRAFAGYGVGLAVAEMESHPDQSSAEITFVGFTPKPRTVGLEVRRDAPEEVLSGGIRIPCERITLHPKIPFPVSVFVHADDAHLWFTRTAPRVLVRAEQNLIEKDDPVVVVDVIPRTGRVQPRHGAPSGHR